MNHPFPTAAIRNVVADMILVVVATLAVALLVLGYAQTVAADEELTGHSGYSDIEANGVFHREAIDYLIEQGVLTYDTPCVGGTDHHSFCPNDEMPRWQVAVWVARAMNVVDGHDPDPTYETLPADHTFTDVDDDDWWVAHVVFLSEAGVLNGYDDGDGNREFRPDQLSSRAQMATVLQRAFDVPVATATDVFADVDPGGSHADAIDAIAGVEITVGCTRKAQILASGTAAADYDENNRYYCPASSPKQQMATLLARAMTWKLGDRQSFDPPPVETDTTGSKAAGAVPETGAGENLLLGGLFILGVAASIACSKIWLDTHKRQRQAEV